MSQQSVELKEIADQIRGVTYAASEAIDQPREGYIGLLRANNIQNNRLNFDDLLYVPQNKVSSSQLLVSGDILIAASSGSLSVVGKAGVFNGSGRFTFGAFCKVIRARNNIVHSYLANYFFTKQYRKIISSLAAGANINNLRNEHIDNLIISYPAIDQQKYIATLLDTASNVLRLRAKAIAELDLLIQSIFVEMFGDLTEGGNDWPKVKLGDFQRKKRGSIDPSKYPNEKFTLYSIPSYDIGQVERLNGSQIGSAKQVVSNGDVLVSKIVPHIRRAWVVEDDFEDRKIASGEWIVFNSEQVLPKFFRYYLLSDAFRRKFMQTVAGVGGSLVRAQPRLVAEFDFFIPPMEMQKKFEEIVTRIEVQKNIHINHQITASKLLESLQHRSFAVN